MSFSRIFGLSPINRTAAVVTSQRGTAQDDAPMNKDELLIMLKLMERKSRLLKMVLSIGTKTQHKNAIYRFNKGRVSNFRDSRAMAEYVRLGDQMQVFLRRIADFNALKNDAKEVSKAQRRLVSQRHTSAKAAEGVDGQLSKQILKRDGYQCLTCFLPSGPGQDLLASHIIRPNQGGTAAADNLKTICMACWDMVNKNEVTA